MRFSSPNRACLYGAFMGLFAGGGQVIMFCVQPFPASLTLKWFFIGIVQCAVVGAVLFFVCRPKAGGTAK